MNGTPSLTEAYDRGRKQAETRLAGEAVRERMEHDFFWARSNYIGAADLDFPSALVQFARARMDSPLDLARMPECRGLRERVEAERRGFGDVVNDPALAAYLLDWYWFVSRRLNTRYVGKTPPPAQCTDFWFADSREGGPIHGTNRDDVLFRYRNQDYRRHNLPAHPAGPRTFAGVTCIGGVSSAVLCDEEPECLFPVPLTAVIPTGIADLKEYVGYLDRYREFWGPANQLWTDAQMNFVALEKANVRLGARFSTGCCAITACAYLTPAMNAFKKERDAISFAARGWPADNPDRRYWDGAEARYRRLLGLVGREHARGATAIGAAHIALDHAVPFPDRICIAGEKAHPAEKDDMQNWTLLTSVSVTAGPNVRSYNWVIDPDDPRPIYRTPCSVNPSADNAARRAQWEAELAAAGELGRPAAP